MQFDAPGEKRKRPSLGRVGDDSVVHSPQGPRDPLSDAATGAKGPKGFCLVGRLTNISAALVAKICNWMYQRLSQKRKQLLQSIKNCIRYPCKPY